jgi:hypothetical protein
MQLLSPRSRPSQEILRRFRTSPWGLAVAFLAILGGSGFAGWLFGRELLRSHGLIQLLALPMIAIGGLVMSVILLIVFKAWTASLHRSNWLMLVARDGLFLNLRSYMNADFEGEDPTTAFFSFGEIASARKVEERWTQRTSHEARLEMRSFLELELAGVDTGPLAEAVRVESAKPAPEHAWFGVKIRSKAVDVPVFVQSPGVVRVQWRRGMLGALEEHVRVLEKRKVNLNAEFASKGTIEHCRELLQRGEKIEAIEVARKDLGIGIADARDRVEEIDRRVA